jgi:hypothetical protein
MPRTPIDEIPVCEVSVSGLPINRTKRSTNAILCLSSWAVTPILLQPSLFARPLGVSENALSGRGKEVAQLVVLNASEMD